MTRDEIELATLRLDGLSLRQIADKIKRDKGTVARRLSKAEVADYIDKAKAKLVQDSLPRAISNLNHAINSYQGKESDTQLREHGFKASQRIMETAGVLPTASGQTINVSGDVTLSHTVQQIIATFGSSLTIADDDAVDVTPD